MPTGRNRRTFGAVSKWEGAGVQQRREAGGGQGSGSEGYKPPPLSPGCCSSAQPAHTCHARAHLQHTSQDSTGAGWGANPGAPQPPLLPEAPAHSATSRRLSRPRANRGPAWTSVSPRAARWALESAGTALHPPSGGSGLRSRGRSPFSLWRGGGVHGATARPPLFPSGPAGGGGCVLSVCPLFPGHQGRLATPPPLQRRGAGWGGRPDLLTSSFPAPAALTPQALPRRKIQLVSSNCSAEEPEKGAKEKGDPPGGWCVRWGRGVAGGEGPGGQRAGLSPCVSAASPSLSVSKRDFMCPPCAHIIPCTSRAPMALSATAWAPWESTAGSGFPREEAWGPGAAHTGGWDPRDPHRARLPLSVRAPLCLAPC